MKQRASQKNKRGNYEIGSREWTPQQMKDLAKRVHEAGKRSESILKPRKNQT